MNRHDDPRTDYIHDEKRFEAEIREVNSQCNNLDEVIQTLRKRGHGALWICKGLESFSDLDPMSLKCRVLKAVRELRDE